ncbi:MAG: hypothetical protein L0Y80_06255 [Ignavibacteriae bacterium]|nr:hypothetical protein [Ignavibacteriota bacterium]
MSDNISTKTKRDTVLTHVDHRRPSTVQKTNVRLAAVKREQHVGDVSQKERLYFEYCLKNEPLLSNTVELLIDGDAYPSHYTGKPEFQQENWAHIRWGRVTRNIGETVNLVKTSPDTVEATVVTTIDGAMKISAPYHMSRRKRHAVLFKPFQETCTRTVVFHRTNHSLDPAQAWKMAFISGCQGGTHINPDTAITALRLTVGGGSIDMHSAFRHSFILNGNKAMTPHLRAAQEFGIEVKLCSKEIEQNMVVARLMADEVTVSRMQLGLRGDCREGSTFCQEYAGKIQAGVKPGVQRVVVEAVSRSSLYEPGVRMTSNFWIFPIVIL